MKLEKNIMEGNQGHIKKSVEHMSVSVEKRFGGLFCGFYIYKDSKGLMGPRQTRQYLVAKWKSLEMTWELGGYVHGDAGYQDNILGQFVDRGVIHCT